MAINDQEAQARLSKIASAVDPCGNLADVLVYRKQAHDILHDLVAAKQSLDALNRGKVVVLLCEYRAGQILHDLHLPGGDRRREMGRAKERLRDLGVHSKESRRWQILGSLRKPDFLQCLRQTISHGGRVTTTAVLRLAGVASESSDPVNRPRTFSQLARGVGSLLTRGVRFGCIFAEAPWHVCAKRAVPAMCKELRRLPVSPLAAGRAHLYLWTPFRWMEYALTVPAAWGFAYQTAIAHRLPAGQENWLLANDGAFLLCVRGETTFRESDLGNLADRGEEFCGSTFRDRILRVSPAPFLDLFASSTDGDWASPLAIKAK
jgi:hypothetical protein